MTASVTGRVDVTFTFTCLVNLGPLFPCVYTKKRVSASKSRPMSLPRLEPVVLITSHPPSSPSQKRKHREEPSDPLSPSTSPKEGELRRRRAAQSGKAMYVCRPRLQGDVFFFLKSLYRSIPSARVEVLLPPLGSWKRRLCDQGQSARHQGIHSVSDL